MDFIERFVVWRSVVKASLREGGVTERSEVTEGARVNVESWKTLCFRLLLQSPYGNPQNSPCSFRGTPMAPAPSRREPS